jgi:hypothetical protein
MTADAIKKATDDELRQVVTLAEQELKDRAEKRKQATIEEIRRIAGAQGLQISFRSPERKRPHKPLHAGQRFSNPDNPEQIYEVDKGRPPGWFERLRAKGRLPEASATLPANDNQKESTPICSGLRS